MKRIEAIKTVLDYVNEGDIVVSTTGMISRETYKVKDKKSNFYILGSMGLVSSVGLGIALNSRRKVFIFDGDGSVLMDMGTMATIGCQKPKNLTHIILDNEAYGSTGGQPTLSNRLKLDKIAIACGYAYAVKACTKTQLVKELKNIVVKNGPHFILVKVLDKSLDIAERVELSPVQIKKRFISFTNKG